MPALIVPVPVGIPVLLSEATPSSSAVATDVERYEEPGA